MSMGKPKNRHAVGKGFLHPYVNQKFTAHGTASLSTVLTARTGTIAGVIKGTGRRQGIVQKGGYF